MIPVIDKEICVGCGKCVEVCPPQALTLIDDIVHLREDLCEECGFCAPECPLNAIEIHFPLSTDPLLSPLAPSLPLKQTTPWSLNN